MKNVKFVSVLIAVSTLVLTSCASLKRSSAASASNPLPPPVAIAPAVSNIAPAPIAVNPMQVAVAPMQMAAPAPAVRTSNRPKWVSVSVFSNLLNARPGTFASGASVLVTNRRTERIAIQIGDRLLGVNDENGNLGVMILPPGESFSLLDPGLGQRTVVKAVVIDKDDNRLGYVGTVVMWPRSSGQEGGEVQWDVRGAVGNTADPMVLLPVSTATVQSAPVLSPLGATP